MPLKQQIPERPEKANATPMQNLKQSVIAIL
jgi:hypothetical protein